MSAYTQRNNKQLEKHINYTLPNGEAVDAYRTSVFPALDKDDCYSDWFVSTLIGAIHLAFAPRFQENRTCVDKIIVYDSFFLRDMIPLKTFEQGIKT
jgi:hypothetical protein